MWTQFLQLCLEAWKIKDSNRWSPEFFRIPYAIAKIAFTTARIIPYLISHQQFSIMIYFIYNFITKYISRLVMILLSVVVIIFIVIIMSIALHSFVCGKRKEILFECLVVLALEHQLGTLSTEINIKRKSIQIKCWILRQVENRSTQS